MPFKPTHHDDSWGLHDRPLEPPHEDLGINKSTTGILIALLLLVPIAGPLAAISTCLMRKRTSRGNLLLTLAVIALLAQSVGLIFLGPWILQQFGIDDPVSLGQMNL
jgi:hypothetical protein